jgi:Putative Flp pilus-assembly TadE/G-like
MMFQKFIRNQLGNTTLIFSLAAIPMLGAAGVAVDSFRAGDVRSQLDAALDGAVIAGAAASSNYVAEAEKFFDLNFDSRDLISVERSFTFRDNVIVTGTATAKFTPSFSSVLGYDIMSVDDEAEAEGMTGASNVGKLCILALAPNASQSLLMNSGAQVNAASCEVHVSSQANPAAIFNAGTDLKAQKTCIKGGNIIDNGGTHDNLETNCNALSDPYAGTVPEPVSTACDYNNGNYSGKVTLNPGVYCGWHNFNNSPTVDLNPGTYIIKSGGWNVNGGTWKGDGVTFYYADTSKIQFNSAVKADLKAPKSGDYADFLFAEKAGLSNSQFVLDDNKGFDMTGIMYLPSRDVIFNSGTKVTTQKMTAVMNTVIFNGVNWNLVHYENGQTIAAGEKIVRLTK